MAQLPQTRLILGPERSSPQDIQPYELRVAVLAAVTGIVYAADRGADVINLSGSPTFDKSEPPGILVATQRAVNYAFRKGSLLVTVAHRGPSS